MSKTIDERVVSMQFDNRNFENNVRTTMSTLDKLKARLKLDGASKGLESVNAAAKNCNLAPIDNAIETNIVKFSKLQAAAAHVLGDIATRAYRTGESILKSLTIQPITTGFNEYELKMNSIQTIMASTGESLETVNSYLNELNKYSDETIYSFADMTQNIGKFTNAGVKLEDAVTAIKGIANEAALSGANANEASRAMYNFSQALSTGYIQRIDWKSIELANMATVEFKEQLLGVAAEMETVAKTADGLYSTMGSDKLYNTSQMFIETLDEQWLTSEVLIETLKRYADAGTDIGERATKAATEVKTFTHMMDTLKESAQSGWAQTWETIVGDFNEGKSLWTSLNDVIGGWISKSADARNKMLSNVLDSNWEKLAARVEEAGIPIVEFQEALIETGKAHNKVTDEMIKEEGGFIKSLKKGWATAEIVIETLEKFTGAGEEVADVTEKVTDKVEYFQKAFDKVWRGDFGNGAKRVKALTEAGYDYVSVQKLVNKHAAGYKLTAEDLADVVADLNEQQLEAIGFTQEEADALVRLRDEAKETGTPLRELIDDLSKPTGRELLIESFVKIFEKLKPVVEAFKSTWDKVFGEFPTVGEILEKLIDKFAEFADSIDIDTDKINNISTTLEGLFRVAQMGSLMAGGLFAWLFDIIKRVAKEFDYDIWNMTAVIANVIIDFYNWIKTNNAVYESIKSLGTAIANFIVGTSSKIKTWFANFEGLPWISKKITDLANSFSSMLPKITEWLDSVVTLFSDFFSSLLSRDGWNADNILAVFSDLIAGIFGQFDELLDIIGRPLKYLRDLVISFFAEIGNKSGTKSEFYLNFFRISDAVEKVTGTIEKAVDKLRGWIKALSDWFKSLKDVNIADLPTAIGEGLGKAIGNILVFIRDGLKMLAKGIYDGMTGVGSDGVAGLVNGLINGVKIVAGVIWQIGTSMITTIMDVLDEHSPSKVMMAIGAFAIIGLALGLKAAAPEVWAAIVSFGSTMLDKFKTAFIALLDWIKSIDIGQMISLVIVGGMLVTMFKVAKLAERLAESVIGIGEAFKGLAKSFKGIADNIKNAIERVGKAIAFKQYAAGIKDIAIGIALLAGSIILLTKFADYDKMWEAFGLIAALTGVLAAFMVVVRLLNINKGLAGFNFKDAVLGMIGLAASLLILAVAAKKFEMIDPAKFESIVGAMLDFLVGIAIVMAFSKNVEKAGRAFIGIGIAMMLIAKAAEMAGSIETGFGQGIGAMVSFAILIGILMAIAKKADANMDAIGTTILKIGAAFLIMAAVAKIVGGLTPEQFERGVGALAAFGFMVVALLLVLELIAFYAGKDGGKGVEELTKLGNVLLKVAGAMIIMAAAVMVLGMCKPETLKKGLLSLAAIWVIAVVTLAALSGLQTGKLEGVGSVISSVGWAILAMAGAVVILASIPQDKIGHAVEALIILASVVTIIVAVIANLGDAGTLKGVSGTLLSAAATIAILAVVASLVAALTTIDATALWHGVGIVAALSVLVGGLIFVSKYAQDAKNTLIGVTILMGVLVAALVALTFIKDTKSLWHAVGSLVTLMIALGVAMVIMKDTKIDIGSFAAVAGAMLVLGGILFILGNLKPGAAIESAAALSLAIMALAAALIAINKFGSASSGDKKFKNTTKMLWAMAGVAFVLGAVIAVLAYLDPGAAIQAGLALGIAILALAGAIALINNFSASSGDKKFSNTMTMLVGMVAVVAAIGLVLAILGTLEPGRALASALGLMGVLLILAVSIAIINSVGAGSAMDDLIGMSIALLAIGAAMLMIAQIPEDKLGKVFWTFAGAVIVLTAALAVLALVLGALARTFTTFAPGAALVVGALLSIAVTAIAVGAAAVLFAGALYIVGMALPLVADGFTLLITSLADCAGSAGNFIKVAEALSIGMSLLGIGLVTLSVCALIAAVALGVGLVVAAIALTAGLAILSVGLIVVSAAILIFSGALMVGASAVFMMGEAIMFLGLAISEGLAAGIASGIEMVTNAVTGLAEGVLGTIMRILDINSPSGAAMILGLFTGEGYAKGLSDSSWMADMAASGIGEKVLNKLSSILPNFSASGSESANAYSEGFKNSARQDELMDQVVAEDPAMLSEFTNKGSQSANAFGSGFVENFDMAAMAEQMGVSPEMISMFTSGGAEGGLAFMEGYGSTADMQALMDQMGVNSGNYDFSAITSAGTQSGTAYMEGFSASTEDASIQPAIDSMLEEISAADPKFTEAGTASLIAFGDGLTAASSTETKRLGTIVSNMASSAEGGWSSFYSAGKHLVSGFTSGITANTFKAEAASAAMATAAYEAAKEALDINSPSKVFRALGKSVPEGFAIGIGMMGNTVAASVDTMANTAINETRNVISRIADVINTDIDTQPTIRPVLDLSEVASGASAISGLFGVNPSVGVLANVGSINSMMNRRSQNGTNADVVSAIDELSKRVDKMGNNNYYTIDGITYDDGSNIANAVKSIARAAIRERRV